MMLHASQYNACVDSRKTNCLAFALGQTEGSENSVFSVYNLEHHDRLGNQILISDSFKMSAERFGLKVKEVNTLEETNGKFAFIVWGWYPVHQVFGGVEYSDFHVLRRNPDGSYEHKPDWYEPATLTTLDEVLMDYSESFHIFVLEQ